MTNQELANQLAVALAASANADALAIELLTALDGAPGWYDVGPPGGKLLIVWPGWQPLKDPLLHVKVIPKGT